MGLICPKLSASPAMHVNSVGVNIALKAVRHFGVNCNKLFGGKCNSFFNVKTMGFSPNKKYAFLSWEAWLNSSQLLKRVGPTFLIQDEPLEHLHERADSCREFEFAWCGECLYHDAPERGGAVVCVPGRARGTRNQHWISFGIFFTNRSWHERTVFKHYTTVQDSVTINPAWGLIVRSKKKSRTNFHH